MGTASTHILVSNYSLLKGTGSLEKWLIPGLRHGKYEMSLEILVVPENKSDLKID